MAEENKELLENNEAKPEKEVKSKKKRVRDKSPEAKKRRRKKALIIVSIIVAVFLLFVIIVAIGSAITKKSIIKYANSFETVKYENQLKPVLDSDSYYTFTTDRPFKVLQLTDIHVGGGMFSAGTDKNALNAVAAMVTAEKPDLVIATGDIAYPVVFAAGTADNMVSARAFAELMEKLGVYWTMNFGNHDTESYSKYKKDKIAEMYMKYDHCLLQAGPSNIDGIGNSIIKIKNSKGLVERALVTLDSHQYLPDDPWGVKWHYDNIKANQTKWYAEEIAKINAANKEVRGKMTDAEKLIYSARYEETPSSLFFHIPIKELKEAWLKYRDNGNKSTADVTYKYGRIGESGKYSYHGVGEDDVYDTMVKVGGDSAFFGHDHYNNISLEYAKNKGDKPVRLTYGVSLDYLAYPGIAKKGEQRGCTVIMYEKQGMDVTPENYYQEKYQSKYKKEKVKINTSYIPKR